MKKPILETIIALTILAGSMWGAAAYFAKASELEIIEARLDQKIVSDAIQQISHRMWQLEDRNGGRDHSQWSDQKDRDEYRKLQLQLESLRKKYDILMRKGKN